MKKSSLYLMFLGAWLSTGDALAQDFSGGAPAQAEGSSVSGIFDGMVVGGTTRKTAGRNRAPSLNQGGMRDSFAINPAANNAKGDIRKNRVQMRSDMIPAVDAQAGDATPAPVAPVQPAAPAQPAPDTMTETANSITSITQQAVQGHPASPQYYKQLINQVKGQSDKDTGRNSSGSKYVVSDKDKF